MIAEKELTGIFTTLRPVEENDAEAVLSLRLRPEMKGLLNRTEPDVEKQRLWIRQQRLRDGDYYFLILDGQGSPRGTISLYGMGAQRTEGQLGRWMCLGSAINSLESLMLVYDFGFFALGLRRIFARTDEKNRSVLNLHKRFGATLLPGIHADPSGGWRDMESEVLAEDYPSIRSANESLLRKLAEHDR